MKKILFLIITAMFASANLFAWDFEADGFQCKINEDGTSVTIEGGPRSGDLVIPSTVSFYGIQFQVKGIDRNAFQGSDITSVEIHSKIIDFSAFYGCESLKKVTIGKEVTDIYEVAFYESPVEELILEDGSDILNINAGNNLGDSSNSSSFYPTIQKLYLGRVINDNPNKHYPFSLGIVLKSLTISENLKEIGDRTFQYCYYLEEITIPDNVQKIGRKAFSNSDKLKSIKLPAKLAEIGDSAFYFCNVLESITLPKNLSTIGNGAFASCKILQDIVIPESVVNIQDYAFSKCEKLKDVEFPTKLKKIGAGAFDGCNLSSVVLPSGLTEIGAAAFYGNPLTDIVIPDPVKKIGASAFSNCKKLASAKLPESLVNIGNYAFYSCEKLKDVEFPAKLRKIGAYAFSGCSSFNNIVIPNTIDTICTRAFYNSTCTKITIEDGENSILYYYNVDLHGYLSGESYDRLYDIYPSCDEFYVGRTSIYDYFNRPIRIKSDKIGAPIGAGKIILGDNITKIPTGNFKNFKSKGIICKNVTDIGGNAFANCEDLKLIEFSKKMTKIESYAFYGCKSLSSVNFSDKLVEIGQYAFSECYRLSSVNFPESLTEIGDNAFSYCNLTSIDIPKTITELAGGLFEGCSNLETVRLPEGLLKIGGSAFSNCVKLTHINFPESLTEIGGEAFYNATRLDTIRLGKNFKVIGDWAFRGTSGGTGGSIYGSVYNVANIFYSLNPEPPIAREDFVPDPNSCTFVPYPDGCTVYVPKGCKGKYSTAPVWRKFGKIIELEEDAGISTNEITDNSLNVYVKDRMLYVENGNDRINRIELFDLAGKQLAAYDTDGSDSVSVPTHETNGVVIVKIALRNSIQVRKIAIQ